MSIPRNQQEELFSADKELADFLTADDPMMVFSREIYPAFKDEEFAQCYSTKGRWATSPAFLACVTILQFRENVVITEKEIDRKVFIQAEEIQIPKQTIFDPRDLSLKLGKKASKGWVGSKCHVVETSQKGKFNFITNMIYQQAQAHDCNIHEKLREGNEYRGLEPEKMYGDMSYINGGAICEYRKHGQELMGYIRGQHAKKPEKFKAYSFSIDMQKLQTICPAGQLASHTVLQKDGYVGFQFRQSTCVKCSFWNECVGTTTPSGRKISVSPYYDYIRERREKQKSEAFRKEMSVRAQIEGTISEGTRFHGLRHARYHGEFGHQMQFYLTGAAINVKRLIRAITRGVDISNKAALACKT